MNNATNTLAFTVEPDEISERLDKIITMRLANLSRVKVQQLIKEGHVKINDKVGKPAYRLEAGDHIHVDLIDSIVAPDVSAEALPEAIPLDVIYEDDDLAAINKPAGMVVHPAVGHTEGTLVNAMLSRWPQVAFVGGEGRAGIIHRLDMDTSGVILIAKTEPARLNLMAQFAKRTVQKRYLALVEGQPATQAGTIDAPLDRDPVHRKKMTVIKGGREAVTEFHVLETYNRNNTSYALLECFPKTGRTHQIRVHLAFINHPIVGDTIYGRRKQTIKMPRHFLHAESITLTLPSTDQPITLHAPLPADLALVLANLREG
ncbi:MAG: RluA family pseudouridine synthase [Anaerolineae bacterium]|nr:RluA family pseudouridine synthase [Anaerolineae bacterium]